jgi:small subunit ribosomal protein S13
MTRPRDTLDPRSGSMKPRHSAAASGRSGSLLNHLRSFYGVGRTRGAQICEEFGYLPTALYGGRSSEAVTRIDAYARGEEVVRLVRSRHVKRKVKLGTFAGIRRRRGLPARGQRTQTNASTAGRLNIGRT